MGVSARTGGYSFPCGIRRKSCNIKSLTIARRWCWKWMTNAFFSLISHLTECSVSECARGQSLRAASTPIQCTGSRGN